MHSTHFNGDLVLFDLERDAYTIHGIVNPCAQIALMDRVSVKQGTMHSGIHVNFYRARQRDFSGHFSPRMFFDAMKALHAAHRIARRNRIQGLVSWLHQSPSKARKQKVDLNSIVKNINIACLIYHGSTRCLHRAAALVRIALKHGYDARLIIGVQTQPFLAHAWAEVDSKVVGESPHRRKQLAVIAEFPSPYPGGARQ